MGMARHCQFLIQHGNRGTAIGHHNLVHWYDTLSLIQNFMWCIGDTAARTFMVSPLVALVSDCHRDSFARYVVDHYLYARQQKKFRAVTMHIEVA